MRFVIGSIVKERHPTCAFRAPGAGVPWWVPAGLLFASIV
jgi:hypothetical protein